ncbi:MAG: diphosphomevalonate decarboxylase [Anaerolineales bacterium]|nr:diphosphomevalonate decarboxylase [Anaerolineales bacterium]
MPAHAATAVSCANIAFIKYWGNTDEALRLPANASLSMNLAGVETETTVTFVDNLAADEVFIGGAAQSGTPYDRVVGNLDLIRERAGLRAFARVESKNNFPAGAGIASSASAFAALSVAGAAAAGLKLTEAELSALARRGSGSAARSVPGGFVEWGPGQPGQPDSSFGVSIAPPGYWDLVDVIAVISQKHKIVGSTGGHALAGTSPLQAARVGSVPDRLERCRAALLARDFDHFAEVVEADSNIMHAVMMTSAPPLFYWEPITLAIIKAVRRWRAEGLPVCYSIDAGPNVHCLCPGEHAAEVERRLRENLDANRLLVARPGGPARLLG